MTIVNNETVNNEVTSVMLSDCYEIEGDSTEDLISELQDFYYEYKDRVEEIDMILKDELVDGEEFTGRLTGKNWDLGLNDGYEFGCDTREQLVEYLSEFRDDWNSRCGGIEYEMEELVGLERTKELLSLS